MDPAHRAADVVVVQGGRIAAVGATAILDAWPGATRIDLGGHTLAPGFIDAHNHLSVAALQPCWGDASGVDGPDAVVDAVHAQAAAEPGADWVRLHGWNDSPHGYTPTCADLDAAGVDRPVVVTHFSLHQCVASSATLAELEIGRATADPPGGEIGRDADGEPNGLLVERAWSEAHARSFAAYADPDRWADHVAARARVLLRDGITAVHDAACAPEAEALYASMARAGSLPISVVAMPHPSAILRNDTGERLDGPVTGAGDEDVRVGAVKLFADGGIAIALDVAVGGHPVALRHPDGRSRGVCGHSRAPRLPHRRAHDREPRRGCRTRRVHRRAPAGRRRRPSLPARARRSHGRDAVGPTREPRRGRRGATGLRRARRHPEPGRPVRRPPLACVRGPRRGGRAAGGIERRSVRAGRSVVGRRARRSRTTSTGIRFEPDQAVDVVAWLEAYTAGAAYAGGQEDERGRLASGLRADLVVLDLASSPASVVETWVAGRRVFARDAARDVT